MASAFKIFSVLMNTAQPDVFVQETNYAQAISRLGEQYFEPSRPNIDITNENFLASSNMFESLKLQSVVGVVVKSGVEARATAFGEQYFAEKAATAPAPPTALEMTLAPPPIRTLEAERLRAMIVSSQDSAGTSTDVEIAPQESIDTQQSIWGHLANAATVEITASNLSKRATELGQAFFGQQKAAAETKVQAIRNKMRKQSQEKETSAEISVPPTRSPDEIDATASVDAVPTISPDQRDSNLFDTHGVTHAQDSTSVA
jgi:hypothetical protein